MLNVLMELLRFLIENQHLLFCSTAAVFLALVFLERERVRSYNSEEGRARAMIFEQARDDFLKKFGIMLVLFSDRSCSRLQFPQDICKTDYITHLHGVGKSQHSIKQIHGSIGDYARMETDIKGVVDIGYPTTEKFGVECLQRIN